MAKWQKPKTKTVEEAKLYDDIQKCADIPTLKKLYQSTLVDYQGVTQRIKDNEAQIKALQKEIAIDEKLIASAGDAAALDRAFSLKLGQFYKHEIE